MKLEQRYILLDVKTGNIRGIGAQGYPTLNSAQDALANYFEGGTIHPDAEIDIYTRISRGTFRVPSNRCLNLQPVD